MHKNTYIFKFIVCDLLSQDTVLLSKLLTVKLQRQRAAGNSETVKLREKLAGKLLNKYNWPCLHFMHV